MLFIEIAVGKFFRGNREENQEGHFIRIGKLGTLGGRRADLYG
jgi:hypothetical protein